MLQWVVAVILGTALALSVDKCVSRAALTMGRDADGGVTLRGSTPKWSLVYLPVGSQ